MGVVEGMTANGGTRQDVWAIPCHSGIYMLENIINGKRYIGQTNNFRRRWIEHRCKKTRRSVLGRAKNKYGIRNFKFHILEECSADVIDEREKHYIKKLEPEYNMNQGGLGNKGHSVSEGVKKILSEKCRAAWLRLSAEKKQSIITNNLIGAKFMIGRKQDDKMKARISASLVAYYKKNAPSPLQRTRAREVNRVLLLGNTRRKRAVEKIDLVSGIILEKFAMVIDAAKSVGVGQAQIIRVCRGRGKTCRGFAWRYSDKSGVETIPQGSRSEIGADPSTEQPKKTVDDIVQSDPMVKGGESWERIRTVGHADRSVQNHERGNRPRRGTEGVRPLPRHDGV